MTAEQERELGVIATKLAGIEEMVKEIKANQAADHGAIAKINEAIAALLAREALRGAVAHESASGATKPGPAAITAGAAAGGITAAAVTKIMSWLGIGG